MKLPRLPWPVVAALGLAGLAVLHRGALGSGFLNDDYFFLEDARTRSLVESLADPRGLANYFRPLSRQVWFELLTAWGGGSPIVFHAAQFALYALAIVLLVDLLRAFVRGPGAIVGALYFATLPLQRVNLTWTSCSQDLLALTGVLGAFALHRRGRPGGALACATVAMLSKESALPLPLAIAAWEWLVRGQRPGAAVRRASPYLLPALAWLAGTIAFRTRTAAAFGPVRFEPDFAPATLAHFGQTLLGLEHPAGFLESLLRVAPSLGAFVLLAPVALAWPRTAGEPAAESPSRPAAVRFAIVWMLAFALVTAPVAYYWSSYHYTLAAVGGALLVAVLAARATALVWVAAVAGALVWHAAGAGTRSFAVREDAWSWTSHLSPWYFERGAVLTAQMRRELRRLVPAPAPETRFFFAILPPWAGFQMGNGPLLRDLYRDPTIESYFYSQFSQETAGDRPCEFLYWDGERFDRLWPTSADRYFQVGTDLLLLDRPRGAMHALQRSDGAPGDARARLYWYGWAAMFAGDRALAEASWVRLGARDDSAAWVFHLRTARGALADGDTVLARQALGSATLAGMGRPEAHAVLAEVMPDRPGKWALLETKVAAWLKPTDWLARRDLAAGLATARLDAQARREFEAALRIHPHARTDSVMIALARELGLELSGTGGDR